MRTLTNWYIFCLILLPFACFGASFVNSDYWQCVTHDQNNNRWSAQNEYQKVAINLAFSACKKESSAPKTCKTSSDDCEGFYQGISIKPLWRCAAMDKIASVWRSRWYNQRQDAALAAKAYCRDNSSVAESCYVNLITCKNLNATVPTFHRTFNQQN